MRPFRRDPSTFRRGCFPIAPRPCWTIVVLTRSRKPLGRQIVPALTLADVGRELRARQKRRVARAA